MSFKWWWQDKRELALWHKLNKLTPEERQSKKYAEICKLKIEQYGNIYFFQPYPKQEPVHKDTNPLIFIHGNNSSGKSYCAAAYTSYEVIGWSPYRQVPPPKYGRKIIWAFSPTFDIQRTSSQVHLFSTDSPNDIGLLPKLETIEKHGGTVRWNRKGVLDMIEFPDGTVLEFKSAEQQSLSLSASGIDFVWFDECPPSNVYDECIARIIRKDGRMIMSFLIEDASQHYIVSDIYSRYQQELSEQGTSTKSFYFFSIEDNLSLDPDTIEQKKSMFHRDSLSWRFSEGGKFVTELKGLRVYSNFVDSLHVRDDLILSYNPTKTLWRAWDLGKHHPVCIGAQYDGVIKVYFSIMGNDIQLTDFIDQVEEYTRENFPRIINTVDILPHDARRRYDVSPYSAEDIFHMRRPPLDTEVMYVHKEPAIDVCNELLRRLKQGQAFIQIDSKHASLLVQCLTLYTRDEKGELRKDDYFEHLSDAFKLLISYLSRNIQSAVMIGTIQHETPSYLEFGTDGNTGKRHPRLFFTHLD